MARGRTKHVFTHRVDSDGLRRIPDELIVEEPMSIRLDDELVATTMRTPGDDFELAAGFCFTEGLLREAEIKSVRYCGQGSASESEYNDVTVDTAGTAAAPTPRLGPSSSSCGICGAEAIEQLYNRLSKLEVEPFDLSTISAAASEITDQQALFTATGTVHAAAAFNRKGDLVLLREDIGRHNAVDKVIGRLLLDKKLPAKDLGLWVSSRASFEMVQKAWAAGFPALVAVSGPSALAVETANRAGLQLAGFARGSRLNIYNKD